MGKLKISAKGLSKRFNREWIFHDFTFDFNQDGIYAITGPNGSGKSTLLQVLWGQMPASIGNVSYYLDNQILPDEEIYQHLSVATPYMDLIEEFTLEEQLQFHFKIKPIKSGFTLPQVIESMYLQDASKKPIGNFSSGMKQRLKLGLAFFTETPIIFLDEPGTNLDHKAFEWYLEILEKMGKGRLILIASNQPKEYPQNTEVINISMYKYNSNVKSL